MRDAEGLCARKRQDHANAGLAGTIEDNLQHVTPGKLRHSVMDPRPVMCNNYAGGEMRILSTDIHTARWCAAPGTHYDLHHERDQLDAAVEADGPPAGSPADWSDLQWARLFQQPPGPVIRPVYPWRSAVRVLLRESGPVAATEVLLAHVRRHGGIRVGHAQEAPAARDVRQTLAGAPDDLYAQALEVAERHRLRPEARRLAAYLFPDQPWWTEELSEHWLDLAPLPQDVNALPEDRPEGIDPVYLRTMARAYGDAVVPRITRWCGNSFALAQVLLDMGTDASIYGWVTIWSTWASKNRDWREGIEEAWEFPHQMQRAILRMAVADPALMPTARRWINRDLDSAAVLEVEGEGAALLKRLQSPALERTMPSGWIDSVAGSRRFPPPPSDGLDLEAAVHAAPKRLLDAGIRVGPPRTWSRDEVQKTLLALDRFHADVVTWLLQDAGPVAAVAALLDTAEKLGSGWAHAPAARRVRNRLASEDDEVYAEALEVAVAARGDAPDDDLAAMSAFLFPDQPWWLDVLERWSGMHPAQRAREIAELVPLPADPGSLPEFKPIDLGFGSLLPTWTVAYGAALEPRLVDWLGQDSGSDGAIEIALLWLGTPSALAFLVTYAYEPYEGFRRQYQAREKLEEAAVSHPGKVMWALAEANLEAADTALVRLVWQSPDAAEGIDHPKLREFSRGVRPSRPPTPIEALPACFHTPPGPPEVTARVPRPKMDEKVRLSDAEKARVDQMLAATADPRTGFDAMVAQIVAEGTAGLCELLRNTRRSAATAAMIDDLSLVAMAVHGAAADDVVRLSVNHRQAPPVALCTERAAKWMVENFDLMRFDVSRANKTEQLSEHEIDDVWRTRLHTRAWVRGHPDEAAAFVLWGALSPAGAAMHDVQIRSNEVSDLLAALRAVVKTQGPSEELRYGSQQAIPWMLHHLPGVLERVAAELGVSDALAAWKDHPGPVTAQRHADREWLETWRLPWLSLRDGRVLSREATEVLLDLLAHTDPSEPHPIRSAAIGELEPDSAHRLSKALRTQWEEDHDAFGLWVLDVPGLLGDPEAHEWLNALVAEGCNPAKDALVRRGDEQSLLEARLSVAAMNSGLRQASQFDPPPPTLGLQARLDDLRIDRGKPRWVPTRSAPPVTPPGAFHDDRYAVLKIPIDRFECLVGTGWIGTHERWTLQVGRGLHVALELLTGRDGAMTLGRVALRDQVDPQRMHSLATLSDADWGQVVADLDRLTKGLGAPDKSALATDLARVFKRLGIRAKWMCIWAARGDAPSVMWERTVEDYDESLATLSELAAPFGGFVAVETHPDGVFLLTWKDGEQVIVGEPPEPAALTGVAMAVTIARDALL